MAFRRMPRLTAGHLVDEATVTWLPLASAKGSQFDSVFAPPGQQKANERAIPLPSLLRPRSKSYLEGLCSGQQLSIRELARPIGASRAAVRKALGRFGIPQNGNGYRRIGTLPFGDDYLNYQLVKNKAEYDVSDLPYNGNGTLTKE